MERLVIEVPAELFSPAESIVREGVFDPASFSCGPDEFAACAPFSYSVVLSNVGGAILVTGTVTGEARTSCARCLDDMTVSISGEVEGYFIIEGEGQAPEDMDEDEFDVLPESHEIDLETLLMAAILVDLPLVPLCDEDCKGICAPEDMDEDEFDVLPESHEIDLETLLMAAILVDLPLVPLCDEDCKGICAQCGANLNEGACDCAASVEEDDCVGKNNPFAALKGLSFD